MSSLEESDDLFFDRRFLDKHAGDIISSPTTAVVELIANAWDAYARTVRIQWPNKRSNLSFKIDDDGNGLSLDEFQTIWKTIDYNRLEHQGSFTNPPPGVTGNTRSVFGRNGKGRFAAFCFSDEYEIFSEKNGSYFKARVARDVTKPFKITILEEGKSPAGNHSLVIESVGEATLVNIDEPSARDFIASRFLANPEFNVYLNTRKITFGDIADDALETVVIDVAGAGKVTIHHIDSRKADRTTKQHGIAWWVQKRAVGECKWRGPDYEKILDGRKDEAKRYTFIVEANFLNDAGAVKEDWSEFNEDNDAWQKVYPAVQNEIKRIIRDATSQKREAKREGVMNRVAPKMKGLSLLSKERVQNFIDQVVEACPSMGEGDIANVSAILANLENSKSRYGLLEILSTQTSSDLDDLHDILSEWSVSMAKIVLDEIQTRLRVINELSKKIEVNNIDELHELQPLFEKGLWIFGPQFESIHYTSNRGMTKVIQELLGVQSIKGSRSRPDFVVLNDSSVGFYACSSYDDNFHEDGIDSLAIIDLKTTNLQLGEKEKSQVWGYIKELLSKGLIKPHTKVHGFVLGSKIEPAENSPAKHGEHANFLITPMLYSTVLKRAESRLLNLYSKVKEAPFIQEHSAEIEAYLAPIRVKQDDMLVNSG
jgi:DNA mismatch repair enzyme (predicted ATPase)